VTLADRIATIEMLIYRDADTGDMRTYYRDYSRTEARISSLGTTSTTSTNGSNAVNNAGTGI